ncbi:uncharacterized protein LOC105443164 [Strongylocentrotus purpuratus]|uniref:Nucleotide-diphospho-sugar transferase domain-containing protein n=1 Tax=Strongylocentrotus purpuratus TaxID=7668 RepID=A0A7M7HPG7_STRPU|nr:uncharacterized protein LOC105443164 [Strongylocentrotus purpuratus]
MAGHRESYAARDHSPASSSSSPSSSPSSSSSTLSVKTSGKCPQTYFLLCALTVAQVGLLSLFFIWTVQTCYTRYQRVIIVYPIDSNPRLRSMSNDSHRDDISHHHHHHHLHGNKSNITTNLLGDIQHEGTPVFGNDSGQISNFLDSKRNVSIVGTTRFEVLALTIKWLESLKILNLDYDVTLIVEDQPAYRILSKRKNSARKLYKTRLKARRERQNGTRVMSLTLSDCDVVLDILGSGRDVLNTATDYVWLKDPIPLIWQKYNQCDIWIKSGENQTQVFMFLKSSPKMISCVKALKTKMARKSKAPRSLVSDDTLVHALRTGLHRFLDTSDLRICHLGEAYFP